MNLATDLTALETKGLVRSTGAGEYSFRHTLFQETAYHSLLRGERAELHRSVAKVLEHEFPEGREGIASILGHHFYQAGDELKALKYFTIAAEEAAKVYANQEAIDHFRQSIDLALKHDPDVEQLTRLFTGCGRVRELMGDFSGALETYAAMEATSKELGLQGMGIKARVARDTLFSSPSAVSDHQSAKVSAQETLRLAREAGDHEAEARSLWNLMMGAFFLGEEDASREYGEEALTIARGTGNKELQAFVMNDLSRGYLFFAEWESRGTELLEEAMVLWKELDNLPMLSDCLNGLAMWNGFSARFEEAEKLSKQALSISEEIDNPWGRSYSAYNLNQVYAHRGRFLESLRQGDDALRWSEIAGFIVPKVASASIQAWVLGTLGQYDEAVETASLAYEFARESLVAWSAMPLSVLVLANLWKEDNEAAESPAQRLEDMLQDPETIFFPYARVWAAYALSESKWHQGEYDKALDWADQALELQGKIVYQIMLIDTFLVKSRALLGMGEAEQAWEMLELARQEAVRTRSDRILWLVLYRMSLQKEREGQADQAAALRTESRQALETLVNLLEGEAKQSFLGTHEAAAVWNG